MATSLVRLSPFRDLDLMERNMRRVFEGFGLYPSLLPAADVYETTDEYVVELEVPGYDEKELGIEVSDHTLTATGERKHAKAETEKTFRLHERLEKQFERTFVLPAEADTEKVKATFKQGVMEVRAPKARTATPTKVPIAKTRSLRSSMRERGGCEFLSRSRLLFLLARGPRIAAVRSSAARERRVGQEQSDEDKGELRRQ